MIKLLLVLMLFAIVGSLFSGLFFLFRDRGGSRRAVRALILRVALSMVLFLALLLAFRFGYIAGYGQQAQASLQNAQSAVAAKGGKVCKAQASGAVARRLRQGAGPMS